MWVYQEPEIQPIEKGPITPPPSLPPVPEQEPLPAIVQSTPETTVPHIPETEVLSRTAPASHRERSAPHQGCVLLAGSYLSGAFTAGILQALLDTRRDGHAFLLPALSGAACLLSRALHSIAQLFVAPNCLRFWESSAFCCCWGYPPSGLVPDLSFYHAVWRWSRAIDIPAVFRHTTSAGVVLSFYFRHPGGTGCRCTLLVWLLRAGSQRKTPCFFSWAGEEPLCPCPAAIGTICTDRRSDASALRSRHLSCLFGQSAGRISVTVPCGHRRNVV